MTAKSARGSSSCLVIEADQARRVLGRSDLGDFEINGGTDQESTAGVHE